MRTITLADDSYYSFEYESTPGHTAGDGYVTGRLASITLPTDGTIRYTYTGGSQGINCLDGSTAGLTRATTDELQSTHALTTPHIVHHWDTTVTDAAQNQSVYTFAGIYETQRQIYQGTASPTGTRVREQHSCYNGNPTNCETATVTAPITSKYSYVTLDTYQSAAIGEFYNSLGELTRREDYDQQSSTPLKRVTVIDYDSTLGNNIADRPAQIRVLDSNNNQMSQVSYVYDDMSLTPTSGLPNHQLISGSHGNLTHKYEWLNNGPALGFHGSERRSSLRVRRRRRDLSANQKASVSWHPYARRRRSRREGSTLRPTVLRSIPKRRAVSL